MIDDFGGYLIGLIVSVPGIIIAMVIHEWAHARVAYALGDYTPKLEGRLTLNPAVHIDLIGLLMLFLVHFGWARPVRINANNFANPRRDDMLVSVAGPAANLIMAFFAMVVWVVLLRFGVQMSEGAASVLQYIIYININFAIFNMLPIPPLDGSHILRNLLPYEWAYKFAQLERYSLIILIVLLMFPTALNYVFIPLQRLILGIFNAIIGIFV